MGTLARFQRSGQLWRGVGEGELRTASKEPGLRADATDDRGAGVSLSGMKTANRHLFFPRGKYTKAQNSVGVPRAGAV